MLYVENVGSRSFSFLFPAELTQVRNTVVRSGSRQVWSMTGEESLATGENDLKVQELTYSMVTTSWILRYVLYLPSLPYARVCSRHRGCYIRTLP